MSVKVQEIKNNSKKEQESGCKRRVKKESKSDSKRAKVRMKEQESEREHESEGDRTRRVKKEGRVRKQENE